MIPYNTAGSTGHFRVSFPRLVDSAIKCTGHTNPLAGEFYLHSLYLDQNWLTLFSWCTEWVGAKGRCRKDLTHNMRNSIWVVVGGQTGWAVSSSEKFQLRTTHHRLSREKRGCRCINMWESGSGSTGNYLFSKWLLRKAPCVNEVFMANS